MTDATNDIGSVYPPLPCNAIVYRTLIKKRWINEDTGEVLADAFFRRKDGDTVGVSVNIATALTPAECTSRFKKCNAVASLHVGRVRDLGLDIIQDKLTHANIMNLPYREDDLPKAEKLAGLLAKQSRIIRTDSSNRKI
jgi:hypothetical protein